MTTTDAWLAWATADAERRGLPELSPLLTALASAQRTLRAADWNEDAASDPQGPEPAPPAGGVPGDRP